MKFITKIILIIILLFLADVAIAQKKKKKKKSRKVKTELPKVSYEKERSAEKRFLTGMKYYLLEDYERALTNFKKSYDFNPNNAGCSFQIAQIYLGSDQPLNALPFCQKSLILNPENLYYHELLAQCYMELGKFKEAAKSYENIISLFPDKDDYYFDLANIYLQQGDVDKGLKAINKIEKKYGASQEITEQKQQIYLSINKFEKAVEEGEKLMAAFPLNIKFKVEHARLYLANDDFEKAKSILLELDNNNKLESNGKILLSDVYWSLGEKEKSSKQLLEAFADPKYSVQQKVNIAVGFLNAPNRVTNAQMEKMCNYMIELHPDEAKVYIAYGDYLIKNERKKESRDNYIKALKLDDSFYKVWQNVVIIDSDLNENDSIIAHTEKALEIFPNQGIFWYYNGASNLAEKEYKKASFGLEKAQKLTSNNNSLSLLIYSQLGDSYNGEGRFLESDKAYEYVLTYDPNNAHALNNYSYYLSLRNDKLEKAKEMCEKLITLEPSNSTYLDTYGWVLYKDKDYIKAKELIEKALLNSEDGTIVEHYGDVLYQLGNKEEAFKQWAISKSTGDYSDLLEKKLQDKKLYDK